MARAKTKEELLSSMKVNYEKLNKIIEDMEEELSFSFDFSNDIKKKEAHWKRDKNLRDVLVHLYEWQKLLIEWVEANRGGEVKSFLPEEYNWKTYGDMNVKLWEKHQETELGVAKDFLSETHEKVIELAKGFTDEELFEKGKFSWVGGTSLGSYFVSVGSSHYDWAMKKLKEHKKIRVGKRS